MVKQRKTVLSLSKTKVRTSAESSSRYGITPLSGEAELVDLASSLANYSNNTLSRLIERIKSL